MQKINAKVLSYPQQSAMAAPSANVCIKSL